MQLLNFTSGIQGVHDIHSTTVGADLYASFKKTWVLHFTLCVFHTKHQLFVYSGTKRTQ